MAQSIWKSANTTATLAGGSRQQLHAGRPAFAGRLQQQQRPLLQRAFVAATDQPRSATGGSASSSGPSMVPSASTSGNGSTSAVYKRADVGLFGASRSAIRRWCRRKQRGVPLV